MKHATYFFAFALCLLSPAYAGLEFSIYNGMDRPIKHTHGLREYEMDNIAPHSNAGRYIPGSGKCIYNRTATSPSSSLVGSITIDGKTTDLGEFFSNPQSLTRGVWNEYTETIMTTYTGAGRKTSTIPVFNSNGKTDDGQTPNSFSCDTPIHFVVDRTGKIAREENGITMALP